MPQRLPHPRLQAVGLDGRPLAGAKLYTFATGTNTPKATWSDAGLSILNANPLTADAAGRFGPIFVGPGDYRITLEDAAGSVISTDDPVEGSSSVTGTVLNGPLTLAYANPFLTLNKAASGQANTIEGDTNGVTRWRIVPGNSTAESGANAGSDFDIEAHNDAGSFLSRPLRISRSTGAALFGGAVGFGDVNFSLQLAGGDPFVYFDNGDFFGYDRVGNQFTWRIGNVEVMRLAGAGLTLGPNGRVVVVDRAYAEYTTYASLTAAIPNDDTIPQVGEGTQILSATLTPKSATNRVRVRAQAQAAGSAGRAGGVMALFVNGAANAVSARVIIIHDGGGETTNQFVIEYEHVPGSTSAQTYTVRMGPSTGTMYVNGLNAGRRMGGAQAATLTVEEITP